MKRPISVVDFAMSLYEQHPELARPVRWPHFLAMAERSGVSVRIVPLSRPARLIRYGQSLCIRIKQELNYHLRTLYGMHELCHVWRDEFGGACIYADEDTVMTSPREDFADLFAWYVTSEARDFVRSPAQRRWDRKVAQLEAAGISLGAIATLTSQPLERVVDWKHGVAQPDPATGRVLDRILAALPARFHAREERTCGTN